MHARESGGDLGDGVEVQEGRHEVEEVDVVKHRHLQQHTHDDIRHDSEQALNHSVLFVMRVRAFSSTASRSSRKSFCITRTDFMAEKSVANLILSE